MIMSLKQFSATARTMTLDEYEAAYGVDHEVEEGGGTAREIVPTADLLRVYPGGTWIARMGERVTGRDPHNWYLTLGETEYDTFRSGQTLAELEAILWDWTNHRDARAAAAAEEDAGNRLKPASTIESTWTQAEDQHLSMTCRNWRGKFEQKTIRPINLWFSRHPEPAWLLQAWDCEEGKRRDFNLDGCHFTRLDRPGSKGERDLSIDRLALALMDTRPDLARMSLDEWLATHHDHLTREERTAARAILDLHETRS